MCYIALSGRVIRKRHQASFNHADAVCPGDDLYNKSVVGDLSSCIPCILCSYSIFNRISVICSLSYVSVPSYAKTKKN